MQGVATGVTDPGMNALDSGFCLFPVVAEFCFAAHAPLRFAQCGFVPLKTMERRKSYRSFCKAKALL